MKLNLSTEGLARASARHPWTTIGAWLAILVVAMVLVGTLLGDALTTESTLTNNPESVQADNLLRERLGESNNTIDEIAIVRSTTLHGGRPGVQGLRRGAIRRFYGSGR